MTSDARVRSSLFRHLRVAALGVALFTASIVSAAAPAAVVVSIQPTRIADLVMLSGGFDAGLRQGMLCRVTRGAVEIGEVLLVELRPSCSAALIVSVASKQAIRPGDRAAIKVLKS